MLQLFTSEFTAQRFQSAWSTSHPSRKRSAPSGNSPSKAWFRGTHMEPHGGGSHSATGRGFTEEEVEAMAMEDEPF